MPVTTLVLIRHGETDWNVEGRYQGQADPPLNARGIRQAHTLGEQLARELAGDDLHLLFTSPLQRASQTAEIIANRLQIPVTNEPRLQEIHQGDWQTRLRSEIERLYPRLFTQWETQPWEVAPPGGERLVQVQQRVYASVDDILDQYPGKTIGLVCHRIPIALIKMRYQSLPPDIVRTLHLPNTYYEILRVKNSQ